MAQGSVEFMGHREREEEPWGVGARDRGRGRGPRPGRWGGAEVCGQRALCAQRWERGRPLVGLCPACWPPASQRARSRPERPLFLREREHTGSKRGPLALLSQPLPQVHHINANYFLDVTSMKPEDIESNVFSFSSTFEDPSTATYMQFLKEGLRRGLPLLQP